MAKTFKIASKPTFKAVVPVPRVDSDEPMNVTFEFKTMNRRQLADLYDTWQKQTLKLLDEARDEDLTLTEYTDREIAMQVEQVKSIVHGWGFSDEFNDENIEALVETSVSVTEAITSKYAEAYSRARAGN